MIILVVLTLITLAAIVGSIVAITKDGYRRAPIDQASQALLRSQR